MCLIIIDIFYYKKFLNLSNIIYAYYKIVKKFKLAIYILAIIDYITIMIDQLNCLINCNKKIK